MSRMGPSPWAPNLAVAPPFFSRIIGQHGARGNGPPVLIQRHQSALVQKWEGSRTDPQIVLPWAEGVIRPSSPSVPLITAARRERGRSEQ